MAVSDRWFSATTLRTQVEWWFPRVVGIGFTFVLWVTLAELFPKGLMPYPIETLRLAFEMYASGIAFEHLAPTLTRILAGFVGAMIAGGAMGIAMGSTEYGERFFSPFVVMGLALPSIALVAITVLIWGFTFAAPVAAVIFSVTPFIAINIWKGVENIDTELVEMAASFGLSNRRLLWRIIIPNAAPSLFAAVRFGLALSWKVTTVAEVFASSSGVGYKVIQTYQQFQFERTWAWAVVFMVVVILVEYLVFKPLERKAFEYRSDADFELMGAE